MQISSPYRPRVSRETRLLLTAGLIAIAALWLLARIRFPERPVTANPVPSVLSQLVTGPKYDELAREIAQVQTRLQPSLMTLDVVSVTGDSLQASARSTAMGLRDALAVTLIPPESRQSRRDDSSVLAFDAASGLAVVRTSTPVPAPPPAPWTPRQLEQPRYVLATDVSQQGVSLRPVFIGSLDPVHGPQWPKPLWVVPRHADLALGSFVFTSNAELVGLVMSHGERLAIAPGESLLAEAERLLATPPGPMGSIGIDVQDLTPSIASATGALEGVVVSWVHADGPARAQLRAGDVIEAIDDRALKTREHWDVRIARLSVGETIRLRVRRSGETRDVVLLASPPAAPPTSPSLGVTLRARPTVGAEVVRVERGSPADRAGLAPGDVITQIRDLSAPGPSQVVRAYTSSEQGQLVIVAVTRGDAHFVTTLLR